MKPFRINSANIFRILNFSENELSPSTIKFIRSHDAVFTDETMGDDIFNVKSMHFDLEETDPEAALFHQGVPKVVRTEIEKLSITLEAHECEWLMLETDRSTLTKPKK